MKQKLKSRSIWAFLDKRFLKKSILFIIVGLFIVIFAYLRTHFRIFLQPSAPSPASSSTNNVNHLIYGLNMSGAEFGEKKIPGKINTDYIYPERVQEYQYFAQKHLTLIRLPIRWERVQHQAFGPLNSPDMTKIEKILQLANQNQQKIIIDLHNFGRYYEVPLTTGDSDKLADVWTKLAAILKNYPSVYGYELMNEPHDLPGGSDSWAKIAQTVTTAIRTVDNQNIIFIPGYTWQNAQNWTRNNPHILISDPDNKVIYTSHIYFDSNYSGAYTKSFSADKRDINIGVQYSQDFRNWLAVHKVRGMFTEFGVPDNDPQWLEALDNFLQSISGDQNIVGALWWSAGPWWGNYPLSLEPRSGIDRPQMQVLEKYINN